MAMATNSFTRVNSDFESAGTRCAAWLYLPGGIKLPPVIVMAHGFGARRTWLLPRHAEIFAAAGFAVFLFDYRCFGDSDGEPRQMVNPFHHVEDWRHALRHVRSLSAVHTGKIGLWGTSYSGGHVITLCAEDPAVRCAVAHAPYVGGRGATPKAGVTHKVRAFYHGLKDVVCQAVLKKPHLIAQAPEPGGPFAFFPDPHSYEMITTRLIPKGEEWDNRIPARIALTFLFYNPIRRADRIKCPVLIQYGTDDEMTPAAPIHWVAAKISRAETSEYHCGHFDFAVGELFEQSTREQADFFRRHLA